MADLNALIAQGAQFRVPPPVDPMGNMAQLMQLRHMQDQSALMPAQLQHAQQQNALAQQQLNEYTRARTGDEAWRALFATPGANITSPEFMRNAYNVDPTKAQAYQKLINEQQKSATEEAARRAKLMGDTTMMYREALSDVPDRATALQWLQRQVSDPAMAGSPVTKTPLMEAAARIPTDPAAFEDWKKRTALGMTKYVEQNAPKFFQQDTGNFLRTIGIAGLGGAATPVEGSTVSKQLSPFETARVPILQQQANAATTQANTGVGRLAMDATTHDPFGLTGTAAAFPLPSANAMATAPRVNALAAPPAAPTAPAPATTPTEATIGGKTAVPLRTAIAQGVKGNDLFASMPAPLAAQIAAIVDHRAAPPARGSARADQMMQLIQMVDPTYDALAYGTKKGIETAFTSGRAGTTLKSLNVVQDHLSTFKEVANALKNDPVQFVNAIKNKMATWGGAAAPTNFEAVKTVLADELTKAILGTAGALGDRQAMQVAINSANSPEQLAGAVETWQKLIAGQVKGMEDQYKSGHGSNAEVLKLFNRGKAAATGATPAATQSGATVSAW